MVKKYLGIISLFILFFTSCSKDEALNDVIYDPQVQISAQIESVVSDSRAQIGINGKGHFEEGDQITLLYGNSDSELTLSGDGWTPQLNWSQIGNSATFVGFYPRVQTDRNLFIHTVQTNQQEKGNFEKSDLLSAATGEVNKGEKIQLNFKHLMGCLTVKLKSNEYTQQQLENATVTVIAYNQVNVGLSGEVGKTVDHDHGFHGQNIPTITLRHQGNGVFQGIVCPQRTDNLSYRNWLTIKIGNKTYTVNEPPARLSDGSCFKGFESGKNVTFTYSFNTTDTRYSNKLCWVDGLQHMPDPDTADKWIPLANNNIKKQLLWEESYGWYDCNKLSLIDESKDDSNMCWAATSSNMIHWWLDRNRENIDKYCALNNIDPKQIPQVYGDHHSSEVFQEFKDKFENKGGHSNQGLRWYFLGKYVKINDASELINPIIPSGGYFKDVIPDDEVGEYRPILNMKDLTAALKYAFDHKLAIGFSVHMPAFGHHALTMWGAKFDEYGRPCTIYFTDNNDGELGQEAYGLITATVGEYNGGSLNSPLVGRACMEGSTGQNTIEFTGMYFLSSHKNAWADYFRKHVK